MHTAFLDLGGEAAFFGAAVPRHLVHRRSVSEVFMTGVVGDEEGGFTAYAQWPRWHPYFGGDLPAFDPALVLETIRQTTILVAHSKLGVSFSSQFLMSDISVDMVRNYSPNLCVPTEMMITVAVSNVKAAAGFISGFRVSTQFRVSTNLIATGTAGARIVPARTYERLRARRRSSIPKQMSATSMSAAQVGCRSTQNIVLGSPVGARSWTLRVDLSNPTFFDHPLDHIPGALLVEAVRQALRVAMNEPTLDFDRIDAKFFSIVEFDEYVVVVVETLEVQTKIMSAVVGIRSLNTTLMRATVECRMRL